MQIREFSNLNTSEEAAPSSGLITDWLELVGTAERQRLFVELVRMDCVLCERLNSGYAGNECVQRLALLLLFQFARTTSLNIGELVMLMDDPVGQLNRALFTLLGSAVSPRESRLGRADVRSVCGG